ncbi:DUF4386 domain-containing protein [Sphaerisporangium aureirubrum]|uniref:DUF4386 domain-containing protein n=1 Tax=Sphaerisporangium aureirubrum TaxID=1544736 RepID=A0ABW1ND52_9ACTN
MTSTRKTAVIAGVFYFITHVASIAALVLYDPVLKDAGYVLGAGADTRVLLGAILEGIVVLAIVGTAVTLFPVVKKYREGAALGYAGLRVLEAAVIVVGIVSLLAVVTLRRDPEGADASALVVAGKALVAVHDWTFLMGPNFVLGTSTTLLAYVMYASGLVPRFIGVLGLVGGPLVFGSAIAVMFDMYEQVSVLGAATAVPVFAWELSLAGWLVVKGFKPVRTVAAGRVRLGV